MTDLEARQLQAEHQKTVAATSECEESLLRLRDREKRVRKRLAGARAPTAATGKAIASARSLEETSLESQAELQRACNGDARQDEKPDIDTDDLDDQGFREWPNAYHFPPGPCGGVWPSGQPARLALPVQRPPPSSIFTDHGEADEGTEHRTMFRRQTLYLGSSASWVSLPGSRPPARLALAESNQITGEPRPARRNGAPLRRQYKYNKTRETIMLRNSSPRTWVSLPRSELAALTADARARARQRLPPILRSGRRYNTQRRGRETEPEGDRKQTSEPLAGLTAVCIPHVAVRARGGGRSIPSPSTRPISISSAIAPSSVPKKAARSTECICTYGAHRQTACLPAADARHQRS